MGLSRQYATTFYNWLATTTGKPVYREPIQFDAENPMPDEYITYSANFGNFASNFYQAITIYSKSTGWNYVMDIVDSIEQAVNERGVIIRDTWGYMTIEKGDPFYQDKPDEDSSIRAGYVNLLINIYQKQV